MDRSNSMISRRQPLKWKARRVGCAHRSLDHRLTHNWWAQPTLR
jgi:hypothetical protein